MSLPPRISGSTPCTRPVSRRECARVAARTAGRDAARPRPDLPQRHAHRDGRGDRHQQRGAVPRLRRIPVRDRAGVQSRRRRHPAMSRSEGSDAMTTIDTDRLERGRRAFADVMTFPAPDDSTPATANMIDFVFAEVWERPGLSRRDRRFVTLPCVAAADAEGTAARSRVRGTQQRRRDDHRNAGNSTAFRGVQRLAEGVPVQHGRRRAVGAHPPRARPGRTAARSAAATGDTE